MLSGVFAVNSINKEKEQSLLRGYQPRGQVRAETGNYTISNMSLEEQSAFYPGFKVTRSCPLLSFKGKQRGDTHSSSR